MNDHFVSLSYIFMFSQWTRMKCMSLNMDCHWNPCYLLRVLRFPEHWSPAFHLQLPDLMMPWEGASSPEAPQQMWCQTGWQPTPRAVKFATHLHMMRVISKPLCCHLAYGSDKKGPQQEGLWRWKTKPWRSCVGATIIKARFEQKIPLWKCLRFLTGSKCFLMDHYGTILVFWCQTS